MDKKLIGIFGYAQSGKDTAADFLAANYGAKKHSLAAPLKRICSDTFDIPMETFEGGKLKAAKDSRFNMTPREILIAVGTHCFREIDQNVWVRAIMKHIENSSATLDVITDVRFQNEADAVLKNNGVLIRIVRKKAPRTNDVGDINLYNIPHIAITNDSTLEELHEKLDAVMMAVDVTKNQCLI